MKICLYFILLLLCNCTGIEERPIKFSGDTSYIKDRSESLNTKLKSQYTHRIYESNDKSWETHITGIIITDYDHFRGEYKNNVYTTFGVEF